MFWHWRKQQSDSLDLSRSGSIALARLRRETAVAIVFAGLIAGCGSLPNLPPIPPKDPAEFRSRTNIYGLEIALDPWTDRGQVKTYFGPDLLSLQIIPFRVWCANRNAPDGFCLQPESARLVDERGRNNLQSASQDVVTRGQEPPSPALAIGAFTAMVSPLFSLPPIVIGALEQEARKKAAHYARHADSLGFADQPLYPSDSRTGFIYVKLAQEGDLSRASAVRFRVKNMRSFEEKTVTVPLKRE